MRIKTYVLVVTVAILTISAATKDTSSVKGLNPGDLAPGIKLPGSNDILSYQNQSKSYILLQFWASYDAESRARNVQLANVVNKLSNEYVGLCSVSLDENESIFKETIRLDKLDSTTQFHEQLGKQSVTYRNFGLHKGFRNFLINNEGIIVATDITPENLANVLQRN